MVLDHPASRELWRRGFARSTRTDEFRGLSDWETYRGAASDPRPAKTPRCRIASSVSAAQ